MIKNERQYRITKAEARKFERALATLASGPPQDAQVHPVLRQAEEYGLRSQLADLRRELEEYEALRAGQHSVFELQSLDELPGALIRARIALGLSQKDLADRIGVQEQQVQRYEATDYVGASLQRIQEVVQALGLTVSEDVFLPTAQVSLTTLFRRLREAGVDQDFVMSRLLPRTLAARLADAGASSTQEAQKLALQAASAVGRVFRWTPAMIFGSQSLEIGAGVAGVARFKLPAQASPRRVQVYTVYAHFVSLLLLEATRRLTPRAVPQDPEVVRQAILGGAGPLTFESALRYVWNLGIPVLPLRDPSAFHGACFRVEGRNVIVLKQQTNSSARWLFDLLHELWHAGQRPDEHEFTVIEAKETAPERRNSAEERSASQFAGEVLLGSRAEEMAQLAVTLAGGSVERLKRVVPTVATQEDVPVAVLANYLAFRLSLQGINWWGAATNLQDLDGDPWAIARAVLLENADLDALNPADRDALTRAVSEPEG